MRARAGRTDGKGRGGVHLTSFNVTSPARDPSFHRSPEAPRRKPKCQRYRRNAAASSNLPATIISHPSAAATAFDENTDGGRPYTPYNAVVIYSRRRRYYRRRYHGVITRRRVVFARRPARTFRCRGFHKAVRRVGERRENRRFRRVSTGVDSNFRAIEGEGGNPEGGGDRETERKESFFSDVARRRRPAVFGNTAAFRVPNNSDRDDGRRDSDALKKKCPRKIRFRSDL